MELKRCATEWTLMQKSCSIYLITDLATPEDAQFCKEYLAWCAGAKVLAGGTREGPVMEATLLEEVPSNCNVMVNEVFGPVLVLERYAVFRDAINRCPNSYSTPARWRPLV